MTTTLNYLEFLLRSSHSKVIDIFTHKTGKINIEDNTY